MRKVLIIDDHGVTLRGVSCLFADFFPSYKVESHKDSEVMLSAIKKEKFDLLILGLNLADLDSLLPISIIHSIQPDLKILVYSVYPEALFAKRVIGMGAKGYLEKKASEKTLIKAIDVILERGVYLSLEMTSELLRNKAQNEDSNPFEKLSDREFEILLLMIRGYSIKEISNTIRLHTSTISTYKSRVFEKLGVKSMVALIQITSNHGLK